MAIADIDLKQTRAWSVEVPEASWLKNPTVDNVSFQCRAKVQLSCLLLN